MKIAILISGYLRTFQNNINHFKFNLLQNHDIDIYIHKTTNEEILVPMFDARRMEVYFSIFDKNHKLLKSPTSRILSEDFFHDFPNKRKVIFGNGAEKCKSIFNSKEFKYIIEISNPSSKEMGEISYTKFLKKNYADLAYCEPLYLKNNYLKN